MTARITNFGSLPASQVLAIAKMVKGIEVDGELITITIGPDLTVKSGRIHGEEVTTIHFNIDTQHVKEQKFVAAKQGLLAALNRATS